MNEQENPQMYHLAWSQDDTHTYVSFLTKAGYDVLLKLLDDGDPMLPSIERVVSVLPGCSLNLKSKPLEEVKTELRSRHEVFNEWVGSYDV